MLVFQVEKDRRSDGSLSALARVTGVIEKGNLAHYERVVGRLLKKGVRHLVLDLSRVTRVDLKGLGAIDDTRERLRAAGGTMRVVGTELDGPAP